MIYLATELVPPPKLGHKFLEKTEPESNHRALVPISSPAKGIVTQNARLFISCCLKSDFLEVEPEKGFCKGDFFFFFEGVLRKGGVWEARQDGGVGKLRKDVESAGKGIQSSGAHIAP